MAQFSGQLASVVMVATQGWKQIFLIWFELGS